MNDICHMHIKEFEKVLRRAVTMKASIKIVASLLRFTPGATDIVRKAIGNSTFENSYNRRVLAVAMVICQEKKHHQLTVHLCGDSGAGKTTLRKSLYHCIRNIFGTNTLPETSLPQPDKLMSTMGLEKECITKRGGESEFVLYDYGGQDEYHVNHSRYLSADAHAVYVVVVGLAVVDGDNNVVHRRSENADECVRLVERYEYWLRFINSVAAPGSLVITILNFHKVASSYFRNAVHEEIVNYQVHVRESCQLRNLKFWPEIVMGDVLMTREVFESSFFMEFERIVTNMAPSVVTGGVQAMRRHKQGNAWPKVLPVEQFKAEYLLKALRAMDEADVARAGLCPEVWHSLEDFLLTKTMEDLISNGDILEINGRVVTDFNWLTSSVIGKLFRPNIHQRKGWGISKHGILSDVRKMALSSDEIEEITGMARHNFGGDVDALPQLLEQLHVCKCFALDNDEEKYWFPAFRPEIRPPSEDLVMENPVRVVRRRFYLNEDYMFPPGYFAHIYMNIINLDVANHVFGFWQDSMKFESVFDEGGKRYRIGVYVSVTAHSHFDLIVCSSNPEGASAVKECKYQSCSHRVWSWLNCVRSFIYSSNANLVKEWCVDPLNEYGDERSIQESFVKKELESGALFRLYYYGSSGDDAVVEALTRAELSVLAMMLEQELIDVDRDCTLYKLEQDCAVRQSLRSIVAQVQNLKKMSLQEDNAHFDASQLELVTFTTSEVDDLETEVGDMTRNRVCCEGESKTRCSTTYISKGNDSGGMNETDSNIITAIQRCILPIQRYQQDEFDGVHEMPLFPVLSSKESRNESSWFSRISTSHKKRLHFVCPVCLRKAVAGPKGKGYAIHINKDWFSEALPYLKVATLVLRISLRIAGLPLDLVALMEEACAGTDAIMQEAVGIIGEEVSEAVGDPVEIVLSSNEGKFDADDIAAISSTSPPTLSQHIYPIVLPRMSSSDRTALRRLMENLDGGFPLQHSGLDRVMCREQQSAAWVCSRAHPEGGSCQDVFSRKGVDCLKLIYADDVLDTVRNSCDDK